MPHRALSTWSLSLMAGGLAAGNLLLGTLILTTDWSRRLSGPNFTYIVGVAPGWVWGVLWLAAGIASLYGQIRERKWPARLGHSTAAFVAAWWTLCFSISLPDAPAASPTGIGAYATIAFLHVIASVVTPLPAQIHPQR